MLEKIIYYISVPLGFLMAFSYNLLENYGLAIILFTLLTKIILIPLSVWVHWDSIKMVKMQPELNRIKAKFFGNGDMISDEQTKVFKKYRYSPLTSLIPLAVQIILLMGVVGAVKNPPAGAEMNFLGFDLSGLPDTVGGIYFAVPVAAGFSSFLLSLSQNMMNVLQAEQSRLNKYGMMIFSVALSLYLGYFVPAGVALYWIASNLFAILQLVILNLFISPKKYVNYSELEESRKELAKLNALGGEKNEKSNEYRAREKADYKRFFSIANKHLVFYSEKSGFYKYYEGLISELLANSNVIIHYVTNDPDDVIFKIAESEKESKLTISASSG